MTHQTEIKELSDGWWQFTCATCGGTKVISDWPEVNSFRNGHDSAVACSREALMRTRTRPDFPYRSPGEAPTLTRLLELLLALRDAVGELRINQPNDERALLFLHDDPGEDEPVRDDLAGVVDLEHLRWGPATRGELSDGPPQRSTDP